MCLCLQLQLYFTFYYFFFFFFVGRLAAARGAFASAAGVMCNISFQRLRELCKKIDVFFKITSRSGRELPDQTKHLITLDLFISLLGISGSAAVETY